MKISSAAAPMLFAFTLLAAAGAAVVQANAAEVRLSDVGYINAARCAGLADGAGLSSVSLQRNVETQSVGREDLAVYLADEARQTAAHQARISPYWHAQAVAAVHGACQADTQAAKAAAHKTALGGAR